jgi:hypothetical protein
MHTMETVNLILSLVIIGGLILLFKVYLPSYFKEKGKNLAQKEDITSITTLVEKVKVDYNSQIERLKADLNKSIHVHKLQFETEFRAYKDIWEKLILLRNKTFELRPIVDKYVATEEEKDKMKFERLKNFAESFTSFAQLAEKNKPFYPEMIWKELESLLQVFRKEAIGYQYGNFESDGIKYWDEALKNRDQILSHIDSICEAIRTRLEIHKIV